ncbi:polysaccharide pyruvyl transferase family protein [Sphingomonas cavernae]|nr:polysaccharide pyruvyl transferase family protein [Sphingomonas cavernae]
MTEMLTVRPATRDALIADLKHSIDAQLLPLLDDAPFALVDYPDHSNVGDSAIWLGETAFFSAHHRRPAYVSALKNHVDDELAAAIGDGTIFLHGGGNFGTIWKAHQDFRIAIMRRFPDNPIVQLPQSIHFASEDSVEETARAIEAHGRFTLMVRDVPSLEFARRHFQCEVLLAPDMAFYMGALDRGPPKHDLFYLLRTDLEKSVEGQVRAGGRSIAVADWLAEDRMQIRLVLAASRLLTIADNPRVARVKTYDRLARARLDRGTVMLFSGRAVVTDRLHGHILSTLLDLPHVALDNSYRKLGNFIDAWTGGFDRLRTAEALDEASALAGDLLGGGRR